MRTLFQANPVPRPRDVNGRDRKREGRNEIKRDSEWYRPRSLDSRTVLFS